MYWQALVAELMQRIPPAPPVNPPKEDKLADRIARHNPKTYDESYDPVELEEWIKSMEKIFGVIEVTEEKKVTIETFYLTREVEIWWNTVKDQLVGPDLTWNKYLGELRAPITVQRQKEKEFFEIRMTRNITVMQYASKFMELS